MVQRCPARAGSSEVDSTLLKRLAVTYSTMNSGVRIGSLVAKNDALKGDIEQLPAALDPVSLTSVGTTCWVDCYYFPALVDGSTVWQGTGV